jgi:hypothetical protein
MQIVAKWYNSIIQQLFTSKIICHHLLILVEFKFSYFSDE